MEFNLSSSRGKIKQFRIDSTSKLKNLPKESYTQSADNSSINLIIESIPSGALLYSGGMLFVNQIADVILGGSEEFPEVFKKNLEKLFQLRTQMLMESNSSQPVEVWFQNSEGGHHLCEVTLPTNSEQELWLINDITARKQNERLLRILTDVTSCVNGSEFYLQLVKGICDALQLKCVLLAQHLLDGQAIKRCSTIGVCLDGKIVPNFEYEIAGTPCENAVGSESCTIHSGVKDLYPDDHFLVEHQIEAYFSVPMIDKDDVVNGHLILLSQQPIHENLSEISAIKNFTFQAATELSRQKSERKLKESKLRFTMAARGSEMGLWDYNVVTGQVEYDDHWYSMLGYDPGEYSATFDLWKKLIHPDDLLPTVKLLDDYIAGKVSTYEAEVRMKTKGGAWKWILTRGKIFSSSPEGTPLQIIGTHLDIDDLKGSQQIRLENEARLRIIMDQIPAILWTTNCDNQYTSIVGAGLNKFGIQPHETTGQAISDFQTSQQTSGSMAAMHQRTLKGESVRFEQKIKNVILDTHIEPLRNSLDEIIGCLGLAIDVTRQKNITEQLNRQRILLQSIFHSVTDAMIVTDRNHKIVMCNESIQKHFRCTEADLLGRPIQEIIASGELSIDENLDTSDPDIQGSKPIDIQFLRADGTLFHGETIVTPLRRQDNQVTGYIKVIRDITDRLQMQVEKDQLQAQMLHAQKLESLGVLAGGIAHDFNNLLLTILGNTNLALLDLDEDSSVIQNVKNIEIAARYATKRCERLLAYSGRRNFASSTFDLNLIVQETVAILSTIISPHAHVELELSEEQLLIHGDMGQVEQVILNLLTNASEAIQTPSRVGKICIRTGFLELKEDDCASYYFCENITPGQYVFFEIEDNGVGMDEDCQRKMFDPFFTTKFTGRGLGLAGVSGIIRGHKGGLYVQSTVELGSCFRVIIPVSTVPIEEKSSENSEHSLVASNVGYVLVIDDDKSVSNVVTNILNRFDYSVLVANSGSEGVEIFKQNRDLISVILLDMTMPGLNGIETLDLLKKNDLNIPVILTSGLSEIDITSQMQSSEFLSFLKKPYKPQKLVNEISKALLRHQIQEDTASQFD